LVLSFSIFARLRALNPPPALPAVGERIPVDVAASEFGAQIPESGAMLLLVTTGCPACLALDPELDLLKAAGECEGRSVLPVVAEWGATPDSIRKVLSKHDISVKRIGAPEGLRKLGARTVPTVIEVGGDGLIEAVSHASIVGSWPRTPSC
jgi:hypothetical protein